MKQQQIKQMVFGALGIALIFLSTFYFKIPSVGQGYLHLGDGFVLLFASVLSPTASFLCAGLGSAFADIAGGYTIYVVPTFFIKGLEAIIITYMLRKLPIKYYIFAYILGSVWMMLGYYVFDALLTNNWIAPLAGIFGNCMQALVGILIALCLTPIIMKVNQSKQL